MSLTWTTLQNTVAAALVQAPSPYTALPSDFVTLFPQATSYAEGRIYGDLVMLAQRVQDVSQSVTSGVRTISLSSFVNTMVVVERVALTAAGTQWQYVLASLDFVDMFWPATAVTMSPSAADQVGRFWAMRDDHTIVLAPTPDATYVAQVTGLVQPASISATNPTTYLSTVYPDLMTAACMVWLSGALMRNYGSQSDEPQMAQSWESQYTHLVSNAQGEERRRRGLTPDTESPTPEPGA